MPPSIWTDQIRQLPAGVHSKISAQGSPIDLKYMDGNSIIELVASRLEDFYTTRNLVPHDPVYPFTENQL